MTPGPDSDGRIACRELRGVPEAWGRIVLATALVAVIVALSGGFGTGVLTVVPRVLYWVALAAVGAAIGILVARYGFPAFWFTQKPIAAWAIIVASITAPMTLLVAASTAVIHHIVLRPELFAEVFPSTLATTAGMTALAFLVRRHGPVETHAAASDAPPAKFLARLPARLADADLWAIEAEDHYLRLHTSKGQDLILMRLSDAVAELEGIEGARTHRSWWVARSAVTRADRADGRATLTLIDGAEVPVSRAYAKVLREHGWF
jgi:DNA-binding LytR/AlgR family response regulator